MNMRSHVAGHTPRATILIVDDEISNIEIMNAALEDRYEICFAISGEQALDVIYQTLPDLVLLDVLMPGMQGFEVCQKLKADPVLADIPVIFTTGLGQTSDEVHGLSLGAIDYVTKPIEPAILRNRVHNHVELKRLRDHLADMAVTDALTGLHNRRKLDGHLTEVVNSLSKEGAWLSLLMLDIDFFKQFNDAYGHQKGDRCISMVAAALNRAVANASGFSARYGGEEFACILPYTDINRAREVAFEIRNQVQQLRIPHENSNVSAFVTISIGISTARSQDNLSPQLWTKVADEQLYLAKSAGRDQIRAKEFDFGTE